MADSKLSDLTSLSLAALDDTLYADDVSAGSSGSSKLLLNYLLAMVGFKPGGRLTLTSGLAVTTADVTGAGTLYYAPYQHNTIRIYDGTRWRLYTFAQLSLSLTLTSGKNYDVFVYDNSGTLTLELSAAWTNDTTRADALTTQDGVVVKSAATTRTWLGAIRASATNTTEDSVLKRYVSNAYNDVPRVLKVTEATDSWTYTSATARQKNNSAANQVEALLCSAEILVDLCEMALAAQSSAQTVTSGIGIDSTTVNSAYFYGCNIGPNNDIRQVHSYYTGHPGLGYHKFTELEFGGSGGTTTWYGDANTTILQSGMVGRIRA